METVTDISVVGIMTRLCTGQRGNKNSIPGRCKIFCCFSSANTGPRAHATFYSVVAGGIISVSKAAFLRGLVFTPYNVEFRMSGISNSTPSYASMACTWTFCLYLYSFSPDKCLDSTLDVNNTAFGHVLLKALFNNHPIVWCCIYSVVEYFMKYRTVMHDNKCICYRAY